MKRLAGVLIAAGCLAAGPGGGADAATIFTFQFDQQGITSTNGSSDGPLVPPINGTGTFTSPVDLTPGIYALPALSGFSLSFTVNGDDYDQTDITTPERGVAVQIVQSGAGERLFFTETGTPDSDGGPIGGALDLDNGTSFLTFEQTSFGGNFLYEEASDQPSAEGPEPFGRYCAVSTGGVCPVPEPSGLPLLASGIGILFALRRWSSARPA